MAAPFPLYSCFYSQRRQPKKGPQTQTHLSSHFSHPQCLVTQSAINAIYHTHVTNRQQSSLTSWKHKTPRTQTPPGFVETRAVRASTGLGGSPHPSDPATAAAATAAAPPPAFVTRCPPSPTPLPIWPIPRIPRIRC